MLLLCMLATAALWLQHHLGFEIAKVGFAAAATAVWTLAENLAGRIGEKRSAVGAVTAAWRPLRKLLRWASQPRPLFVTGVALILPMITLTSITVMSEEPAAEGVGVTISAAAPAGADRSDSMGRGEDLIRFFPVVTSPFGRLFRVKATGYVPSAFSVYPLIGRRVVLGRDLLPAPTVLFRPSVEGASALEDGGVFRVTRIRSGIPEVLAADTGKAAFRLGQAAPESAAMVEFWGLQLEALEPPNGERARLLMLWSRPRQLGWVGDLAPGDSLTAEIRFGERVVARVAFSLGRERLTDILVADLPTDGRPTRAAGVDP